MEEVEDRIVISKRKGDGEDGGVEKRLRVETQAALAIVEKQEIARSSTLLAPTMLLTGHQAAVYTLKFDPSGLQLASAGADRAIFLWDTRGECNNYNVLRGHKNVSCGTNSPEAQDTAAVPSVPSVPSVLAATTLLRVTPPHATAVDGYLCLFGSVLTGT